MKVKRRRKRKRKKKSRKKKNNNADYNDENELEDSQVSEDDVSLESLDDEQMFEIDEQMASAISNMKKAKKIK